MRKFREFLYTEKLQEIISQLDENLFLEGKRFQEALRQKEEEFKKASFREAVFAGKSYEGNPDRLRAQLESLQEQTVPYLYVEKQEGKITENVRGWAVEKMVNLIHILQPNWTRKEGANQRLQFTSRNRAEINPDRYPLFQLVIFDS